MSELILKGYMTKKTISATDSFVIISKEGSLFSAKREKKIPYSQISGVEVKKPGTLANGYIQIQIPGQISGNSGFKVSGGAYDAVTDENAVVFTGKANYEIAVQMQEYILNKIENQGTQQISSADELQKFKVLLDNGAISEDEYNAKKKQLLGL